jgi:transcription elongation factor Elf1
MPYDPHGSEEEEERSQEPSSEGRQRRFGDFDCPSCNANNPYDDGIGDGDEILCYYCGQEYQVRVTEEGRLRLKEA